MPVGWCGWKIPAKRIMASCHFFRSWMAWQLIRHLCPPLYRRYSPDLDLPGGLANPFDVFEALLTYKNYDRGHFVTFVVWMTSHYSAGCCWRCYRQMRKAYPLGHPHLARVVEATSMVVPAATMRSQKKNTNEKKKKPPPTWGQQYKDPGGPGSLSGLHRFARHPPPKDAAPSTPPGKIIGLYLTQVGPPTVSHLAGASVGDRSSMGGRSGGSAALSQTQWRHAVSVDGVGRVVQVRVGGTAQRQDRPVLGPSVGTPPETGASTSSASIANGSRQRILQSPVSTGLEKTRHSPLFHLRGYQSLGHRTVQPHPERTLVSLFDRRQHLEVRGRAPQVVQGYNASWHRSIGRAPQDVTPHNELEVWHRLHPQPSSSPPLPKLKAGDRVRLSKQARPFRKGYLPGWTEEVFVVRRVVPGSVPTYKVEEFDGTLVQGTFYEPELQRVTVDDDTLWRIEKVLKRRGDQWYVQWKGWPRKYNSWIRRQDLAS